MCSQGVSFTSLASFIYLKRTPCRSTLPKRGNLEHFRGADFVVVVVVCLVLIFSSIFIYLFIIIIIILFLGGGGFFPRFFVCLFCFCVCVVFVVCLFCLFVVKCGRRHRVRVLVLGTKQIRKALLLLLPQ